MIQSKRGNGVRALASRFRRPHVALLLIGLIALAACGKASAEPNGYFVQTKYRMVFIEWTETSVAASSDVNLRGTITFSHIDTKKFLLVSSAAAFTGTLKDTAVSLALTLPLDTATAWSGTLVGSDLTMTYTLTNGDIISLKLKPATRDQFNTALVQEQKALSDLKSGKITGQTDDEIKAGIDQLSAAVTGDLAQLSKDVDAMSAAVPAVTSASNSAESFKSAAHSAMVSAGKHKYGPQICPFADSASANANAASGASAAASSAQAHVQDLITVVKADLLALSGSHGNLAELQAQLPNYKPKGVPSDKSVTDAITAANTAMEAADQGANGGARSAASKASAAQSYAAQAQAKCAAAPQENPSPKPSRTRSPEPSPT